MGPPQRTAFRHGEGSPPVDTNVKSVATLLVVVFAGFGIAVAGSQGGTDVSGIPVSAVCVGLAFAVQWLAFIPAYLMHSERFYDLTGG